MHRTRFSCRLIHIYRSLCSLFWYSCYFKHFNVCTDLVDVHKFRHLSVFSFYIYLHVITSRTNKCSLLCIIHIHWLTGLVQATPKWGWAFLNFLFMKITSLENLTYVSRKSKVC